MRLNGARNFRDLGGLPAAHGMRVRPRRLFRSDHLGMVDAADRQALVSLGLRGVLDLRSIEERAAAPCAVDEIRNVSIPIMTEASARLDKVLQEQGGIDGEQAREIMRGVYRNYIRTHARAFRGLFAELLAHEGPHLFHCTAGKDRTGVAAALVLTALGVDHGVIVQDYLLTNERWIIPADQGAGFPDPVREALGRADASYLAAAWETLEREYGGFEVFAREHLGVGAGERKQLRAWYLAP